MQQDHERRVFRSANWWPDTKKLGKELTETNGQSNVTTLPQRTGRLNVFARWRQYAHPSNNGSLCAHTTRVCSSQMASRSVHPFSHGSPVCPTQTDEATIIATSIYE